MILLVDNNAKQSTIAHFIAIFDLLKQSYKVMNSDEAISLTELQEFKGIILSGGPWDLTEPMLFGDFKLDVQVMINADVPIYGICMGHQIMSESNGANMGKWSEEYHDWRIVTVLEKTDLFKGLDDEIKVMEWHQEFVEEPAPGFKLIATSQACHVQGTKHETNHFYSTQFHPELSGEVGVKILSNFIDICDSVKQKKNENLSAHTS